MITVPEDTDASSVNAITARLVVFTLEINQIDAAAIEAATRRAVSVSISLRTPRYLAAAQRGGR